MKNKSTYFSSRGKNLEFCCFQSNKATKFLYYMVSHKHSSTPQSEHAGKPLKPFRPFLQHTAILHYTATHRCRPSKHHTSAGNTTTHRNTPQHTATRYYTPRSGAVPNLSTVRHGLSTMWKPHCYTLLHNATHCYTLQRCLKQRRRQISEAFTTTSTPRALGLLQCCQVLPKRMGKMSEFFKTATIFDSMRTQFWRCLKYEPARPFRQRTAQRSSEVALITPAVGPVCVYIWSHTWTHTHMRTCRQTDG